MQASVTWMLESQLLDIYLLLAHRIKGLGWNLNDFWEADIWTTSKLYCFELELIEQEDGKSKGDKDPQNQNDPEVEALVEEMFEDES